MKRFLFVFITLIALCPFAYPQSQALKDMTATTAPAATDILYVVISPSGSAANRKVTVDNLFLSRTGNKNLTAYASLSAAVTAIGPSSLAIIEIPATTTVSASLTITPNITLMPTGSGMISVSASQTLTINGPFIAPPRQVFTGVGIVKFGGNIGTVYPRWFGAAEDGTADDTAEIQAAIDSFPTTAKLRAGGYVEILGGSIISSSLTIEGKSVVIRSHGWGVSNEAPHRGYLKWNGSAGSPMILIKDAYNAGVENIRLIGNSAAKPSAAIEYRRASGTPLHHSSARRVFIGPLFGYDDDNAIQFDAGILISGSVDGDTNLFQQIHVNKCTIGVDIQNPNAAITHFDTLKMTECGTGFKCNTFVTGTNWNCGANTLDIDVLTGRRLKVVDFTSEGSDQLVTVAIGGQFYIEEGSYEVNTTIVASGFVIDAEQGGRVGLKNFQFTHGVGYAFSPLYKIRVKSPGGAAAHQWLWLENVTGIQQNQIDVTGPASDAQRTFVYFNRPPGSPNDYGTNAINFLTNNEAFDERRFDVAGAGNVLGGPFRVRQLLPPTGLALTVIGGGSGTTRAYEVTSFDAAGNESLPSAEVSISGPGTLNSSNYIEGIFNPEPGAAGYKVYGRGSGGGKLLMFTINAYDIHTKPAQGLLTSFKDDGAVTPSGAQPSQNTTGRSILGPVRLTPSSGNSWQDITGNAAGDGVRVGGGTAISDGASFQVFPDAGAFPGMYFDAGGASGADINFRKTPGGAMALKVKQGTGAIELDRTITAGGTTGNQTINKLAGTVNIAAAGTTVTVTNSLVTANSIVLAVLRTNDATARIANVVPGSGSFVINLTAAATAEVSIGWIVLN